jgi:hypothetical protein
LDWLINELSLSQVAAMSPFASAVLALSRMLFSLFGVGGSWTRLCTLVCKSLTCGRCSPYAIASRSFAVRSMARPVRIAITRSCTSGGVRIPWTRWLRRVATDLAA